MIEAESTTRAIVAELGLDMRRFGAASRLSA